MSPPFDSDSYQLSAQPNPQAQTGMMCNRITLLIFFLEEGSRKKRRLWDSLISWIYPFIFSPKPEWNVEPEFVYSLDKGKMFFVNKGQAVQQLQTIHRSKYERAISGVGLDWIGSSHLQTTFRLVVIIFRNTERLGQIRVEGRVSIKLYAIAILCQSHSVKAIWY